MFKYISLNLKFIYCISINVWMTLSERVNNESFTISGSNESLILDKNYDSNSYYYFQNGLLVSNSTNIKNDLNKSFSSEPCNSDYECSHWQGFKCCNSKCSYQTICKGGYKSKCNTTKDCEAIFICKGPSQECLCQYEFDSTNDVCMDSNNYDSKAAMQIYKITMIFASCCLALILIIFLVCILRKSYCPSRRHIVPLDNTIPDIFTLFPHVGNYDGGPLGDGTQPPFEKPPTYDETIQLMREEIGIPPPAYASAPNSSNSSTPDLSSRIVITRPALLTVNEDNNNHSLSSTDSSDLFNETSIAGPSGYRQGFVNQAFVNI